MAAATSFTWRTLIHWKTRPDYYRSWVVVRRTRPACDVVTADANSWATASQTRDRSAARRADKGVILDALEHVDEVLERGDAAGLARRDE